MSRRSKSIRQEPMWIPLMRRKELQEQIQEQIDANAEKLDIWEEALEKRQRML